MAGLRQLRRADSPFLDGVPAEVARDAIWVEPRVAGLVDHTGFTADGRLRLPHWRGTAGAGSAAHPVGAARRPAGRRCRPADDHRLAFAPLTRASPAGRAPVPPPVVRVPVPPRRRGRRPRRSGTGAAAARRAPRPLRPERSTSRERVTPRLRQRSTRRQAKPTCPRPPERPTTPSRRAPGPLTPMHPAASPPWSRPGSGKQAAEPVEARRLEQHFVYNSLNAIASLIRTDPARARELLVGFADLSRATDRPADTPSTLGARARRRAGLPGAGAGPVRQAPAGRDRRRPGVHDRPRRAPARARRRARRRAARHRTARPGGCPLRDRPTRRRWLRRHRDGRRRASPGCSP